MKEIYLYICRRGGSLVKAPASSGAPSLSPTGVLAMFLDKV